MKLQHLLEAAPSQELIITTRAMQRLNWLKQTPQAVKPWFAGASMAWHPTSCAEFTWDMVTVRLWRTLDYAQLYYGFADEEIHHTTSTHTLAQELEKHLQLSPGTITDIRGDYWRGWHSEQVKNIIETAVGPQIIAAMQYNPALQNKMVAELKLLTENPHLLSEAAPSKQEITHQRIATLISRKQPIHPIFAEWLISGDNYLKDIVMSGPGFYYDATFVIFSWLKNDISVHIHRKNSSIEIPWNSDKAAAEIDVIADILQINPDALKQELHSQLIQKNYAFQASLSYVIPLDSAVVTPILNQLKPWLYLLDGADLSDRKRIKSYAQVTHNPSMVKEAALDPKHIVNQRITKAIANKMPIHPIFAEMLGERQLGFSYTREISQSNERNYRVNIWLLLTASDTSQTTPDSLGIRIVPRTMKASTRRNRQDEIAELAKILQLNPAALEATGKNFDWAIIPLNDPLFAPIRDKLITWLLWARDADIDDQLRIKQYAQQQHGNKPIAEAAPSKELILEKRADQRIAWLKNNPAAVKPWFAAVSSDPSWGGIRWDWKTDGVWIVLSDNTAGFMEAHDQFTDETPNPNEIAEFIEKALQLPPNTLQDVEQGAFYLYSQTLARIMQAALGQTLTTAMLHNKRLLKKYAKQLQALAKQHANHT